MSSHKRARPIPPGAPGHPKITGPAPGSTRPLKGRYPAPLPKKEKPEGKPERAQASSLRKPPKATTARGLKGQVGFIFEDRDIIVVDKPEGLPVIAPEGSRAPCLYDAVTERIRRKNPKGRAAVVHRLDRESSGVLVFATSGRVKTILMSHWDEMARERVYQALVEGSMEESHGHLVNWLVEAGPSRMKTVIAGTEGSQKAITDYRVIAKGGGYSLLELSLETGRKHQIRVQLAATGHPIAGDERYGATTNPAGRLCLHAVLLTLEHPSTGEVKRFESPAPESFLAACRPKALPKAVKPKAPAKPATPKAPAKAEKPKAAKTPARTKPSGPGAGPSASRPGAETAAPLPRKASPGGKPSRQPSPPRGKPRA